MFAALTIRQATKTFNIVSVIGVIALALLSYSYLDAKNHLMEAQDSRYHAYLLADELRQSSDDLTRLARTYVITAEPHYEQQYLDILAIRNGQKPRPQDYHRIYWDFVAADKRSPRPAGKVASLQQLMKDAGFTDAEFELLAEAQTNSDGLVGLEVQAMNAVKGKFADRNGNYVNQGQPNLALARELLHSEEYHRYKANIMRPVDRFFVSMEERTNAEIVSAQQTMEALQIALFSIITLAASAILFAGWAINRRVVVGVSHLGQTMRQLADGALDVLIPGLGRQDEIGDMARTVEVFKQNAERINTMEAEKERLQIETTTRQAEREERLGGEVVQLLELVSHGNFEGRLTLEGKSGIFETLGRHINKLIDKFAQVTEEICHATNAVAEGDLSHRITADYEGRFGELKNNTNRTAERLAEIVAQIQEASGEVDNAASEIASGTTDLSQRTEQAASNLEETAASTEQMAATVKQNAENAKNANQLAEDADQTATKSGGIVQQAVVAMSGIEGSARKITDIISVIDEIAFQTNLLALNASVEAARAGEAGKGFAVVAQEVRQLAQRSAQAASDIKTLIQDSNGQVKEGVQLVNEAGNALGEIVSSIGKVANMVQEISNASQEQALGVQEINGAIANMDEMTQQNSALVEESTAAARALTEQSGKLAELMAFFKLGKSAMAKQRSSVATGRPIIRNPEHVTLKGGSKRSTASTPALAGSHDQGWDEF